MNLERILARFSAPALAGAIVALFLFLSFPGVWTGRESLFLRDYGVLAYPTLDYARTSILGGELPFWNPLSHSGVPFLAQWGTMCLYPLSAVYWLLPMPWGLNLFCMGHLVLGAAGVAQLAKRYGLGRAGSVLAGFIYVFNGLSMASLIWPNYQVALGWLPWVIWSLLRGVEGGGRAVLPGILFGFLQMMSGVPEVIVLTWLAAAVLCICNMDRSSIVSPALRFVLMVGIIALLSAPQLLPFFDLIAQSQRDLGTGVAVKWALPVWGLGNLVTPLFHFFMTPQGSWFQPGQEFLSSYYLGLTALALAVLVVWRGEGKKRWVLAGLAFFGVWMALGEKGGLYLAVRRLLPGFGLARYPVKFVFLLIPALPLLAGMGWELLERSAGKQKRAVAVILAGLVLTAVGLLVASRIWPMPYDRWDDFRSNTAERVVFLGLAAWAGWFGLTQIGTKRHVGLLILLALIWGDIMRHSPQQNPLISAELLRPGLARETNSPALGTGRSFITPSAELRLLNSTVPDWVNDFKGKRLAEWSNLNLIERVPKVNGALTLRMRHQARLEAAVYKMTNGNPEGLLDFLGVTQISTPGAVVEWTNRASAMAFVSGGQRPVIANDEDSLKGVLAADFDPRTTVFLDVGSPDPTRGVVGAGKVTVGRVEVLAQRITAEVECATPSVITLSQTWNPNWTSEVDGKPVPLLRANHAFQAIVVPSGSHLIRFEYRDVSFRRGCWVALAGLGACGIVFMVSGRRREL